MISLENGLMENIKCGVILEVHGQKILSINRTVAKRFPWVVRVNPSTDSPGRITRKNIIAKALHQNHQSINFTTNTSSEMVELIYGQNLSYSRFFIEAAPPVLQTECLLTAVRCRYNIS